jgi:translation elongation factor EF-1alpha
MNNFKGIGPYVMRQMDKPVGVDFTEFIYTSQTLHKKKIKLSGTSHLRSAHTNTQPCRVDWTNFVHATHRRESHINTTVSFALASFVLAEFTTSSRNYFVVMKHLVS